MTQLTFDFARTLASDWAPGDEVIISRLDHDANIRPWIIAARQAGAVIRWAEFDPETGELPAEAVIKLLGSRTRVVAVTAASNLIGTRPDITAITTAAHAAGALCYVDGVHLTPHAVIDVPTMGADFYGCSSYKFFGPHLGVIAAHPDLLKSLSPEKLLPSSDDVPERFELGTLPYELLAGLRASVDFIADMNHVGGIAQDGNRSRRRTQICQAMNAVEAYEDSMMHYLLTELSQLPGIRIHGSASSRTPTVLFTSSAVSARTIHTELAGAKINAPASSFYAIEASRQLGLADDGGVRIGLAPYTTTAEIDRLLEALESLTAAAQSNRQSDS